MAVFQKDDVFAKRYLLVEKIGIGGFSEVWKAQDQLAEDAVVAIKIYAPERGMDDVGLKQFRREYAVVLDLNHRNLLTARHFDIHEGHPYLVMPFITGGSVFNNLIEEGPWSEDKLAPFIFQITEALEFVHANEVLHQDIKPDNILIDRTGHYLLTDFGISSRLRSTLRKSTTSNKAMTVAYAPPERFAGAQQALAAGDIFSFGVLLFELATGDVPWMGAGGMAVKADSEPILLPDSYSKRFQAIVQACLHHSPEKRPSASDLKSWAKEYIEQGAWPQISQTAAPVIEEPKKEVRQGRSTQRFDTLPKDEIKIPATSENTNGTTTLKQGGAAVPLSSEKNKKNTKLIIAISLLVVVPVIAFITIRKDSASYPVNEAYEDYSLISFDSLIVLAEIELRSGNFTKALGFYKEAQSIFPNDTFVQNQIAICNLNLEPEGNQSSITPVDSSIQQKASPTINKKVSSPSASKNGKYELSNLKSSFGDRFNYNGAVSNNKPNGYGIGYFEYGTYEGNWLDGKRHGTGKFTWNDGKTYEGDWSYDSRTGKGKGNIFSGYYEGEFRNGKPHGYGIATYKNGDVYKGNWNNGQRSGKGRITYSLGRYYDGEWKNDLQNGQGFRKWAYVNYEGSFKDGVPSGTGTYFSWRDDIWSLKNCRKYVGGWSEGHPEGFAKCYDKDGNLLYEGEFTDGKPVDKYPNR